MRRTGWHLRTGAIVAAWLVALLLVALGHRSVSDSRWLLVHLLLLGAVTNAILVWSAHFAAALLRLPDPPTRRLEATRLALVNVGAVSVVAGILAPSWPFVLVGGTAVAAAVLWHAVWLLRRMRVSLPSRFGATLRYYVAAGLFLPVGIGFGITMAHNGIGGQVYDHLVVAHAITNLLGWVGLTIIGTLVTLWPTMLRTRVASGAEVVARQTLPLLVISLLVAAGGALLGIRLITAVGIASYLGAVLRWSGPILRAARARPPTSFATLSVLGGLLWLVATLSAFVVLLALAPDWSAVVSSAQWLTAPLLAGFVLPVLLGALSYLTPVVLGGGPGAVRATNGELDRGGALRVTTANFALLVCVLPVPSLVRITTSFVLLVAYASFLPLLVRAVLLARGHRADAAARTDPAVRIAAVRPVPDPTAPARRRALAGIGLAVVLLAVAGGVAADPPALGLGTATAAPGTDAPATGHTTTVQVSMKGMRFHPGTVSVPAGDRLVIVLTNNDDQTHDLVLENGARTARIDPGAQGTLDAGVIGHDLGGWCSIAGHRQMGMVFAVQVTGGSAPPASQNTMPGMDHSATSGPSAANGMDLMAAPGPGFSPYDATLPPAPAERVHNVRLVVHESVQQVAPGITQTRWTFGDTAPGPTLRGKVGDVFVITLVNDGTIGHSIDFHAGSLAPDRPMRTIAPGESLTYRFTATHSGIWLYHCSTMPMSLHIANGMFGAVVIDPPDLAPVDREYVLVQSELYLGPQGQPADPVRLASGRPDLVVFNGYAMQYDHRPLIAKVGERVRIWVLAAGPDLGTSFHVVGGQFDTVYSEGAYQLRPTRGSTGASQALGLAVAQGGFVELTFPEAGHYPFVNHAMTLAERGAHGIFEVTGR